MTKRLPAVWAAVAGRRHPRCRVRDAAGRSGGAGAPTSAPPLRTSPAISPALADAAQRAQAPGLPTAEDKARMFKGTGVLVKGQQPGGGVAARPGGAAGGRRRRAQFRRRRPARGREEHPGRHPERELHDRCGGRRPGHHPHVVGNPARRAARDARNAAADERRHDGEGSGALQDPAERGGRARQHHAAARQLAARAAAGLFGADRPAALHRHARDDPRAGAAREGRHRHPARRSAQPADPVRHRARAEAPARDDRHVRRGLDRRACRWGCSRCRTPT